MNPGDRIASALWPKSRRAILGLLQGSPDRAFYLREVINLTGLGVGQVRRELNRLAEAGVLVRSEEGRHVYFQANERWIRSHETSARRLRKLVGEWLRRNRPRLLR